MSDWHGDEYRWHRWSAPSMTVYTISVIEPAEEKDAPAAVRRVPFGFGRVLAEGVEREPLLWEGDDA